MTKKEKEIKPKSSKMKDNPEFIARIARLKKDKTQEELLYLAEKPASMIDILDRIAARKALNQLGIKYDLSNV